MALILFNPAPRSGKGDRLPGGGRAWAATSRGGRPPPPCFVWSSSPLRFTARVRINNTVLATRSCARALPTTKQIDSPPATRGRRSAERRMPTIAAQHQQTLPSADASGAAARHADKCTQSAHSSACGARPPSGASTAALAGTPIPAQLQAMLPGTRNQASVTRSIWSQSSDSTSRLGRSTEGNDAQSRSGADCEPARKHRTRSTLQIASGMRPSTSEMSWLLSLSVTKVKTSPLE